MKGWRIQRLYYQTALSGSKVNFLTTSTHPRVPLRILASCADSAVRIVSPVGGAIITTALLPLEVQAICVAYFAFNGVFYWCILKQIWCVCILKRVLYLTITELLYVLDQYGTVVMFDTKTNPSTKKANWSSPEELGNQYSKLIIK